MSNDTLYIENANSVYLGAYLDNTDNQNLSLSGTTINITNGTGVDISSAITSTAWSLTGNSGTTAGTNFLGTTDNISLSFKTNNTERMRILNTGNIGIGTTNPQYSLDLHSALGITNGTSFVTLSGTKMRFNQNDNFQIGSGVGYSSIGSFGAIMTLTGNTRFVGIGTTSPSYPLSVENATEDRVGSFISTEASADNYAVYGECATTDYYGFGGYFKGGHNGVYGTVSPTGSSYYYGVYGSVSGGSGYDYGVYGYSSTSAHAYGVFGYGTSTGTDWTYGVYGNASGASATNIGVRGAVSDSDGYGVLASNNDLNGTAIIGIGNNLGTFYHPTNGGGITANGNKIGVFGYGTDTGDDVWGGYFSATNNSQYAYVGGQFSGTDYKINGSGSVATIVKRPDGTRANMFCPEAPEILFQDYGTAKLVNGHAHITIDPILAKNIVVNSKHPLRVFIQLEGDCKGVYVTNKTQNGFDVVELQNGNSNVSFSWTIVANRADTYDKQGNIISKNTDIRFPDGPGPVPVISKKIDRTKSYNNIKK